MTRGVTASDKGRWVRIHDITADESIPPLDKIDLVCTAMNEWAMFRALQVIHHDDDIVCQRFIDAGGHIRFDADNEPVIWYAGKKKR